MYATRRTMVEWLIVSEITPLEEKQFTFTTILSTKDIVIRLGYLLYGMAWVEHLVLYLMVCTERSMNFTGCPFPQMCRVSDSNALLRYSISNSLSTQKSVKTNPCHVYMFLMYTSPMIICCFVMELAAYIFNKLILDLVCKKRSLLTYKKPM